MFSLMMREQDLEKCNQIPLYFGRTWSQYIKIEINKALHLCTTNPHTAKSQFSLMAAWLCAVYK